MKSHAGSGHIRIVGGEYRGRRLKVLPHGQLRPTSDRVRETLFNWLAGHITNARCLDLFAGSGALGFEALSRGASWVTFIEQAPKLSAQLRLGCDTLGCQSRSEVIGGDSLRWLKRAIGTAAYDVVFVDPPFSKSLWLPCLEGLVEAKLIHKETLVYLEAPKRWEIPEKDFPWQVKKEQTAGEVGYYLLQPVEMNGEV